MHGTRRLIGSLLASALLLALSACSSKPAAAPTPAPAAPTPAPAAPAPAPAKPNFPTKPVTIVVHTAAGGGMDVYARQLAPMLQKALGQPVVVEDRAGGSGATAMQYVAGQPADGYTILGVTDTLIITPIANTTPKSLADFVPVAMTVTDPGILLVKAGGKYKTGKEVLDAAKAGTRIPVAVSQAGSPEAMALDALIKMGAKGFVALPVDAGGEGLKNLLGGQVDVSMNEPGEAMSQLDAKAVVPIAVVNTKRMPSLPDVPTLEELGYKVATDKFRGFMAPKGTPAEVVQVLADAVKKMMEDPNYQAIMKQNYQTPMFLSGADYAKFLADKQTKYTEGLKK